MNFRKKLNTPIFTKTLRSTAKLSTGSEKAKMMKKLASGLLAMKL